LPLPAPATRTPFTSGQGRAGPRQPRSQPRPSSPGSTTSG
jgi:hypothetical protein